MTELKFTSRIDGRPRVSGWAQLSKEEKAQRIDRARPFVGTMSLNALSLEFGIPDKALRVAFVPGYAERQRKQKREYRRDNDHQRPSRAAGKRWWAMTGQSKPDKDEVAARLADIPEDTRTPGQRLMGDPVPERSALFRKRAGGAA